MPPSPVQVVAGSRRPGRPEQTQQPSQVKKYAPKDINRQTLSDISLDVLGRRPFDWQLDAASAMLQGEDVVLDVGTGNGKSLVFSLPLLFNDKDINLIVSPLSALMIDQARASRLPTIAVCTETIAEMGREVMYQRIVEGHYRQVIVSPEIVTSAQFRAGVLSKPEFRRHLRNACIDKAHCISIWGGSFRPDYAELGLLRGRLPPHTSLLVASATLPDHILDDIRNKLKLTKDVTTISLSNDRPNVALSVRVMKHAEDSKADLRFLIPEDAHSVDDIPVTLVYCNERRTTEDVADRLRDFLEDAGIDDPSCVAYYHAKIGTARKREIKEGLREGRIRIVVCTDAVGMGCDMRNIDRVILYGLPPSFCALVQRAGRAARDFTKNGTAILLISASKYKEGLTKAQVSDAVDAAAVESEAQNVGDDEVALAAELGVTGDDAVDEEGVRVSRDSDEDGDEEAAGPSSTKSVKRRRKRQELNSLEARSLSLFVSGRTCRRKVWNDFFLNHTKRPLKHPETTTYQSLPNTRCCDVCSPDLFPVEAVTVSKRIGLTRGRKKVTPPVLGQLIHSRLRTWREEKLLPYFSSPAVVILSSATYFGDDVIERIATCGNRISDASLLRRNCRWSHAFENDALTAAGQLLLDELADIYKTYDALPPKERNAATASTSTIPAEQFYMPAVARGRGGTNPVRSRARGHGRGRGRGVASTQTEVEPPEMAERGIRRGRPRGRPPGRSRGRRARSAQRGSN